jgi:S1-C subfamily serine protease
MEAFAAAKELKEAMSRTQIAEAEKLAEPWVSRRTRPIVPSEATSQAKELMKVLTSALTRNSGELDPLSGGLSIVESKPLPSPETDPIVQRLRPSVERGSTQAKPARLIAEEAFQSVALLMMLDQSNQPVSLGSGFALGNGLIATNYHVISGASAGYVKVVGKSAKYDIRGTVALDTEHDLAIISVPDLRCPALAIADSGQAATGDEVYAVGNPQGLEGTFSQGIISAIRHIGQDSLLQITAPISPGSSGGPVLDKSGAVVGIAVATFNGGQNLNLAIPSAYLEDLRRKVSPDPRPLSSITAAASGRSVATLLGGPSLQGVVGENLTWTCGLFFYCGSYSFSLRNELRDAVQEIYGLAVFLDQNNKPIDVDVIRYAGVIPGGLAKRLTSQVDQSVQRLTKSAQFRILDFRLAQQ